MENQTHKCKYVISTKEMTGRSEIPIITDDGLTITTSTITTNTREVEGTLIPILTEIAELTKDIKFKSIDMKEVEITKEEGKTARAEYKLKFGKGWRIDLTIEVKSTVTAYKVLAYNLREHFDCTVWQKKIENN